MQGKPLKEALGDHGEEGAGPAGGSWALKGSPTGLGGTISGQPVGGTDVLGTSQPPYPYGLWSLRAQLSPGISTAPPRQTGQAPSNTLQESNTTKHQLPPMTAETQVDV